MCGENTAQRGLRRCVLPALAQAERLREAVAAERAAAAHAEPCDAPAAAAPAPMPAFMAAAAAALRPSPAFAPPQPQQPQQVASFPLVLPLAPPLPRASPTGPAPPHAPPTSFPLHLDGPSPPAAPPRREAAAPACPPQPAARPAKPAKAANGHAATVKVDSGLPLLPLGPGLPQPSGPKGRVPLLLTPLHDRATNGGAAANGGDAALSPPRGAALHSPHLVATSAAYIHPLPSPSGLSAATCGQPLSPAGRQARAGVAGPGPSAQLIAALAAAVAARARGDGSGEGGGAGGVFPGVSPHGGCDGLGMERGVLPAAAPLPLQPILQPVLQLVKLEAGERGGGPPQPPTGLSCALAVLAERTWRSKDGSGADAIAPSSSHAVAPEEDREAPATRSLADTPPGVLGACGATQAQPRASSQGVQPGRPTRAAIQDALGPALLAAEAGEGGGARPATPFAAGGSPATSGAALPGGRLTSDTLSLLVGLLKGQVHAAPEPGVPGPAGAAAGASPAALAQLQSVLRLAAAQQASLQPATMGLGLGERAEGA